MTLLRHIMAEKGYSKGPECGRRVVNTEPCPRRYMQVKVISLVYHLAVQVQSPGSN
jgi:hypothetical protein